MSFPRKKILIPIAVCLAIIGAVLLVIKTLSSPAEGTISQTPAIQTTKKEAAAAPGLYIGKYISFRYPDSFERNAKQTGYGYLEVIGFSATDHTGKEISVGVQKDTLETSSGVNYRRARPELYREEPKLANGLVFVSTKTGYERTAFIIRNDLMATVSIMAPSGGDLKAESELILNSLKWQ